MQKKNMPILPKSLVLSPGSVYRVSGAYTLPIVIGVVGCLAYLMATHRSVVLISLAMTVMGWFHGLAKGGAYGAVTSRQWCIETASQYLYYCAMMADETRNSSTTAAETLETIQHLIDERLPTSLPMGYFKDAFAEVDDQKWCVELYTEDRVCIFRMVKHEDHYDYIPTSLGTWLSNHIRQTTHDVPKRVVAALSKALNEAPEPAADAPSENKPAVGHRDN